MDATVRVRTVAWFATAIVISILTTLLVTQAWTADAAPGDTDTTFVPVTACRLVDTRPAPDRVGPHGSLSAADTTTVQATGSNGNCVIPAKAVGLSMNVTAVNGGKQTFLTFWPDGPLPLTSSLNPSPGAPPTPNAVSVALSGSGSFNMYNKHGSVDVVIDINGYYIKSSLKELHNRITALEASQPFTVASVLADFRDVGSTATDIRSVTVTAPVDGHVALIASGFMYEQTNGQFVKCGLMDSVTNPPTGRNLRWQSPTGSDYSHLSASRVFNIAAGATTTYYLVCNNNSGGTSSIGSPQVTATFTPAP
jgi:hypothetical protein